MNNTYQNGDNRSASRESSRTNTQSTPPSKRSSGRPAPRDPERARTIIQELKSKDVPPVPTPDHESAKRMDSDEVEALLVQFVSEKLAHAHLSAQIDNPTRQSVETMAKAWVDAAETIIEAVRRVDRQDPPTSFWEMQA